MRDCDKALCKTIGRNIMAALYEEGKRQADLARYVGVSRYSVSQWVHGRSFPTVPNLISICSYLNRNICEFLI